MIMINNYIMIIKFISFILLIYMYIKEEEKINIYI